MVVWNEAKEPDGAQEPARERVGGYLVSFLPFLVSLPLLPHTHAQLSLLIPQPVH